MLLFGGEAEDAQLVRRKWMKRKKSKLIKDGGEDEGEIVELRMEREV